ncbi:hypothetical protein ACFVJS_07815 [Nocardioides sp. NPDC057772]|uniref:hypothetical protein n=1 Tax=Nocardioides sp. NPDC057772 TaxID=3346245 RepID=UPI00366D270F
MSLDTTQRTKAIRDSVGATLAWCAPGLGLVWLLGVALSGPSGIGVEEAFGPWGRMAAMVAVVLAVGGGYVLTMVAGALETIETLRLAAVPDGNAAEVEERRVAISGSRDAIQVCIGVTTFFGAIAVLVLAILAGTEGIAIWWAVAVSAWIIAIWVVGLAILKRLRRWIDDPTHQRTEAEKGVDGASDGEPEAPVAPVARALRSVRSRRHALWFVVIVLTFALGSLGERSTPGRPSRVPEVFHRTDPVEPTAWSVMMIVVLVLVIGIVLSAASEHRIRRTQRAWLATCVRDPDCGRPAKPIMRHYVGQAASLLSRTLALVAMIPLGIGLAALMLGLFDVGVLARVYEDSQPVFDDHVVTGAGGVAIGIALLALAIRAEVRWRIDGTQLRAELVRRWPDRIGQSAAR